MTDTKQKILDVSLELFSQKGFSAVSIRDICRQVEIKESSVYYHFQNKQAIFDELLCQFQRTAEWMMSQLESALSEKPDISDNHFYTGVCDCFFENYLMDDFCNKVMRLLQIEQLNNEEIQKIYDRFLFHEPLQFQMKIFKTLMDGGVLKNMDCGYMAMKYYSPIFLLAQRWLLSGALSEENKNAFRAAAYQHVKLFFQETGVAAE